MRLRFVVGVVVFFIVAAVVLAGITSGPDLFASKTSSGDSQTPLTSDNPIILENAHFGTGSWKIPPGEEASIQIQAYASATSVLPGQKLTFYVSTQDEATAYSISIYRLGWYEGFGGRLMTSVLNQTGHAQGYYDENNHRLVDCTLCHIDLKTGLIEANWHPSYTLSVPPDWTTGIYLAKFTDAKGKQTYAPFDVRGNSHSLYMAVTPDTTYAAYNDWGGYSLYQAGGSIPLNDETPNMPRAVKVSFDRPYVQDSGSGQVLEFEADAIHWLERQGYDLSYISDVDLHEKAAQLLNHRAYLSLGHDEYWTKEMRDGVEHARDSGVGLAFLGADAANWQMRFEPDSAGAPDRTVVCYKVASVHNDLALDPFYGKDNARLTAQWRDPILTRPENALIGIMYSGLTKQASFPWHVSPLAKSALLDGSGLQSGRQYGCDLVGYEWDRIFANGATPAGLQVLGASPTLNDAKMPDVSNTTYYIAPSGAMVFATGSIYWTFALDKYRLQTDQLCTGQDAVVPGMQKLMAHVMDTLVVHHPL